jgi:hypothetical protein
MGVSSGDGEGGEHRYLHHDENKHYYEICEGKPGADVSGSAQYTGKRSVVSGIAQNKTIRGRGRESCLGVPKTRVDDKAGGGIYQKRCVERTCDRVVVAKARHTFVVCHVTHSSSLSRVLGIPRHDTPSLPSIDTTLPLSVDWALS